MIPSSPTTPTCATCGRSLAGARLVIDRQWVCPDCAYADEHGEQPPTRTRRRSRGRPVQLGLFPIGGYIVIVPPEDDTRGKP